MIDKLTHSLTQMIAHQRQAEAMPAAELSSLLDMVTAQIEYHQAEIARLKPILHRLQARIPTDSFQEFLSALEEI